MMVLYQTGETGLPSARDNCQAETAQTISCICTELQARQPVRLFLDLPTVSGAF